MPSRVHHIVCKDLTLSYGTREILNIKDFSLESGEIAIIEGPSGSGKSSFFHMLAGLILPTAGSIRYNLSDGLSLSSCSLDFPHFRRENISITSAEPLFFEELSVRENIYFPHIFLGKLYRNEWRDLLLGSLEIDTKMDARVSDLSSGERDRVNIIRALLYDDPIVFLDEPGAHLSSDLFATVLSLLQKYIHHVHPLLCIISHREGFHSLAGSVYRCENGKLSLQK